MVYKIEHYKIKCTNNLSRDYFDFNDTIPWKWAIVAMIILQNAAEDYMQEVFATATQLTAISSRTITLPRDICLAYLQKQRTIHGNNSVLADVLKLCIPISKPARRMELDNPGTSNFWDSQERPQIVKLFE